jgi:hypothetical protein
MKTSRPGIFPLAAALLAMLASCLKEGDVTVLVHDPQTIPFITDTARWPLELLELFGEEHVNFGDTPPRLDFSFRVDRQQYAATNLDPDQSPAIGSYTPVPHLHAFHGQYLQVCRYVHGVTLGGDVAVENRIDTVYVTGHDSLFTAYFHETFTTAGRPTHAVVMSGTLLGSGTLTDFRYGYMIVAYADTVVPPGVYPPGSVFVFQNPGPLAVTAP